MAVIDNTVKKPKVSLQEDYSEMSGFPHLGSFWGGTVIETKTQMSHLNQDVRFPTRTIQDPRFKVSITQWQFEETSLGNWHVICLNRWSRFSWTRSSGWWYTYPSEKYESVGVTIPNWMEKQNSCSKPPTSYERFPVSMMVFNSREICRWIPNRYRFSRKRSFHFW